MRAAAAVPALLLLAGAAAAQTPAVQSISPDIDLGPVAAAASGQTVFRAAASSGAVTRISGAGYRVGGGTARALVTLSCGASLLCATEPVLVTISSIGAPSGRMGALDNFTAAENTAVFAIPPVGTDPLVLTVGPIGQNSTKSFYVGADIPILGDDSFEPTGAAASAFTVDVAIQAPGGGSDNKIGQAAAGVFRPLSVEADASLAFGAIVRPTAGAGTVEIDADTGQRSLTGAGVTGAGGAPVRAAFTVSGEGGQAFSIATPESFEMTGPGDPIAVTLSADASGPQTLPGALGEAEDMQVHVGGAFAISDATVPGAYSGSFAVTVQYE